MKKTTVSGPEVDQAFTTWLEAHGFYHPDDFLTEPAYADYKRARVEFHELSETRTFWMNVKRVKTYHVSAEAGERIRAMCGPHGYTYCKAIMARREEVA